MESVLQNLVLVLQVIALATAIIGAGVTALQATKWGQSKAVQTTKDILDTVNAIADAVVREASQAAKRGVIRGVGIVDLNLAMKSYARDNAHKAISALGLSDKVDTSLVDTLIEAGVNRLNEKRDSSPLSLLGIPTEDE